MIYDSAEIIPAKLYFKIVDTGKYSLLSDENLSDEKLELLWKKIEEEHNEINPNKDRNKALDLFKKREALEAKLEVINLSVYHLKSKKDEELIRLLKTYGYQFTENLNEDLKKIERESLNIEVKIKSIAEKIPKPDKNNNNKSSFDETVMSYSAFTGAGFINTNTITLTQYYALINMGNQKLKALENGGKR